MFTRSLRKAQVALPTKPLPMTPRIEGIGGMGGRAVPGGGGSSMGVRGKSVGFKMIDWVPQTTASKVRFR